MYTFKLFHSIYKRITEINVIYLSNLKSCSSKNKLQTKIKLFIKNKNADPSFRPV
jgi:hypothetical protein